MEPHAVTSPLRIAIVGLGRIYDLNVLAYREDPHVSVVALVDSDPGRLAERAEEWPGAARLSSVGELVASSVEVDAVEVLLPIASHASAVCELLARGWHVNLQKPMCTSLAEAATMIEASRASGAQLRVMENYLFYEPLVRLKALVDDGELGEVVGYHLKMVASGRGGWEVPWAAYEAQFAQAAQGRGILVFDDGWHKLSTALWLFGPIREVRAWIGATEVLEGCVVDAPTTIAWEHANGIRGVFDATLAIDLYLRSDYYTNDERWEVTGRRGFARVNRCTGRGLQVPSLEVYRDGVLTSHHALDDDWASSFRASGAHWLAWLRTGVGELCWDAAAATEVLRVALAAVRSSELGGRGVDPQSLD